MNNRIKVALGAAAMASIALTVLAQAQQPEEKFQRTFTVNAGGALRVDNYKGTVHVTGASTNQVVVNVLKRFEGGGEADRKWWMENTKINFRNDGGRVAVTVEYPSQTFSCWFCWQEHYVAQVELEIQVPSRTNLDLNGYKPDIRVSSLQGDIRIKSYKAPMTLESTSGSIHIDTYKDEIRLKNVAVRGSIDIKSYKADTEIDAKSLEGTANLETSRGSIVLRVPRDIGLNVDFAGGRRSGFHTDFALATQAGGSLGRDVRGTINGGGAHLVLRTERGSVSIEKRAGEL
jgi:Putative adhesin